MLNNKKEFKFTYGGQEMILETGRLAKQADASVMITCEGTQVLVNVCSAYQMQDGQDFFPLLVDYKEKFYAAGKFLGGFMKREGRPSNKEILLMRIIDRPLRPLFPEGYMYETVVTAQVMSYDEKADPEILAGLATSAALAISDIPFNGPLGFCKVGMINGDLKLNPLHTEWANSQLELLVAASPEAILMIEGESSEINEQTMMNAIEFAHSNIKSFCKVISEMVAKVGVKKREFVPAVSNKTLVAKLDTYTADAKACLAVNIKLDRQKAIAKFVKKVAEDIKADPTAFGLTADDSSSKNAAKGVDDLLYKIMRKEILENSNRIAGRKLDQIRPIETEVDILKKVHGSSLFTRGETQVLAAITIGGKEGEQMSDSITGVAYDKFYLHYQFPPYSVGEARGYRGVGRREVGHGNLAERALKKMMPSQEEFPYTVRVNCEVLESNGSSSMGSVCSGSMALMDAGIPLKKPVAGIAMGLIKEGENYKILSDILGDEDHLGDMDFKVAGTTDGITAIQMDIKIGGLSKEIFEKALEQARVGRIHILGEMAKTISVARPYFKDGVPTIETTKIAPDKIGALIGPGGKNIKAIQEDFKVTMEVMEDGTVKVLGVEKKNILDAITLINMQINGPQIGSDYDAEVVSIKEYGAFVDIAKGVSGLVHVSEISNDRVEDVNAYLKEGQKVKVKVLDIDRFGKIKLSIKAVAPIEKNA